MKVVFLKDVKGQGKKGEVKEVSEGYARNYLIPNGLVSVANNASMAQLQGQKKAEQKRKDQEREAAENMAKALSDIVLTIKAKAGEGGRLFGSITGGKIADELAAQHNIKADKRKIVLDEPIKTMGVTEVPIKLHPEVTAKLRVQVVEE